MNTTSHYVDTVVTGASEMTSHSNWNWTSQQTDLVVLNDVNRTNYTALIGEFYDDFEHVSETYLMTTMALLGILFNTVAMVATAREEHMRRRSRALHCIFFAAENLFLAGIEMGRSAVISTGTHGNAAVHVVEKLPDRLGTLFPLLTCLRTHYGRHSKPFSG